MANIQNHKMSFILSPRHCHIHVVEVSMQLTHTITSALVCGTCTIAFYPFFLSFFNLYVTSNGILQCGREKELGKNVFSFSFFGPSLVILFWSHIEFKKTTNSMSNMKHSFDITICSIVMVLGLGASGIYFGWFK